MQLVPAPYHDLLSDDNRQAFLVLAFLLGDGTPLTSPVWFRVEGEAFLIGVDPSGLKARRLRENPAFAATVLAEGQHLRYLSVRGRAEERPSPDAEEQYRRMVNKYEGRDPSVMVAQVFFRLVPQRVDAFDYSTMEF